MTNPSVFAAIAALTLSASGAGSVQALPLERTSTSEPRAQVQAPGYFRQTAGSSVITAVYDGYVDLATQSLSGLSEQDIQALVVRSFQSRSGVIQTAVNTFLVDTGSRLVLVDSGSSTCFGPTMGSMVTNIRAAGYDPADVDDVLLTHMHPDHACGVTSAEGVAVFPNATVWAHKDDAAFWLDPNSEALLPDGQQAFVDMARKAIEPYAARDRFKTFDDGQEVIPGFRAIATAGHTPGHTSYLMGEGEDAVLFWGDIVHFHAVQLRHPEVSIEVDRDPAAAIATRQRVLAEVAANRWWIATAHLPFPGIGHVRADTDGYVYVPTEYGPLAAVKP